MSGGAGYGVPVKHLARVLRAIEIVCTRLRGEPTGDQTALVARLVVEGRVDMCGCPAGQINQLRQAGVLMGGNAAGPYVLTPVFLREMSARPTRPARDHDPRRHAIEVLKAALDRLATGDAGWPDVEEAIAPLRDVISRQCCERDNDLDGDCPVHPPVPRRRV